MNTNDSRYIFFDYNADLQAVPYVHNIGKASISDKSFLVQCKKRGGQNRLICQYTISGEVMVRDGQGEFRVSPGKCFITDSHDPEVAYYYPSDANEPYVCVWITMMGSAVDVGSELIKKYGRVFDLGEKPAAFRWARQRLKSSCVLQSEQMVFSELVSRANDVVCALLKSTKGKRPESEGDRIVEVVRQMVVAKPSEALNVTTIASSLSVTPGHLARIFRLKGLPSPRTFIDQIKMEHAAELLVTTTLSIKEIATALGYETSSNLARTFRRVYGKAPGEIRK